MMVIQAVLVIGLILASLNGVFICVKTKTSLYTKLVVCAVICFTLSALNTVLLYAIFDIYPEGFRLSDIGIFSSFMFLLSANYGTMDDIIDEGQKEYKKYRLLAFLAPIGISIIIVWFWFFGCEHLADKISLAIIALPGQAATYFSLKHVILPDEGLNFIRPMRLFNILSVIFVYTGVLLIAFNNLAIMWASDIACLVVLVVGILIVPACATGSKKRKEY